MPSRQQLEIEFEELLNRHSLTINKICWVYSEYNRFYFDELRSRCVIDLWREFSRFRGESSEATWVYQIVLHAAARYFRNPHNLHLPHPKELNEATAWPKEKAVEGYTISTTNSNGQYAVIAIR